MGYRYIALLGDLRPRIHAFLTLYALLFVLYSAAVFIIRRQSDSPARMLSRSDPQETKGLLVIFSFALLFRLMLLDSFPYLSDDIFRYVWDGRVWSSGINPYIHPPADPALAALQNDTIYAQLSHKHVPTVYPPALQLLFRFLYSLNGGFLPFRMASLLFDIGTVVLLIYWLRLRRKHPGLVLLYAWNPLIIVEFAGSGHIDSVGIFFLVAFFVLLARGRMLLASFPFALAVLTKYAPVLLLPFVWRKFPKKQAARFTGALLVAIILLFLPFIEAGPALVAGLKVYAQKWEFNASLFQLIYWPVYYLIPDSALISAITNRGLAPDAETMRSFRVDLALLWAKGLVGILFAIIYLYVLRRDSGKGGKQPDVELFRVWLLVFGFLAMFTTTLHPWYLAWIIPALVFFPMNSWLLLSGLIMTSYLILPQYYFLGKWEENPKIKLLIFLPFYISYIAEVRHTNRLRAAQQPARD